MEWEVCVCVVVAMVPGWRWVAVLAGVTISSKVRAGKCLYDGARGANVQAIERNETIQQSSNRLNIRTHGVDTQIVEL